MADPELLERVDRLNLLIPEITRRFHNIPAPARAAPSLSIPQLRMLMLLDAHGDSQMGELARRASVTMPTATSSVNALVEGRYVSRRRSPQDRRVVLVSLTAKGRRVLEKYREERRQRFAALFEHLSPADQERFVQAFEDILGILAQLDEVLEADDDVGTRG
ncbi:MAG: MarR family winged helix-turn-helix transcriptional regulator [bacterium]